MDSIGESATRNAARAFLAYDHTARNLKGLSNELIEPMDGPPEMNAAIETTERLGGLIRPYRRAA